MNKTYGLSLVVVCLLGCGSGETAPTASIAPAAPPTTVVAPAPTVVAPPWAPAVAPAAVASGSSCAIDPSPLAITTGDLAMETSRDADDEDHSMLRLARRQGGVVRAIRCTRVPAGSMEVGDQTTPTASVETLGGTSLLLVQDTGTGSADGEMDDFIAVWVFDPELRLLDVVLGFSDDGPMRVEGDTLRVGNQTRTLVNGELVTPPAH